MLELSYLSTLKQQNSREAEPASSSAQNRDDVFTLLLFQFPIHTAVNYEAKNRLTNS